MRGIACTVSDRWPTTSTHLDGQYHNLWLPSHTTPLVCSYLVSPETEHSNHSHTLWVGTGTISCLRNCAKSAGYTVQLGGPTLLSQLKCPFRYNDLLTADFSTSKHLQYSEYGTGAASVNNLKHIDKQY